MAPRAERAAEVAALAAAEGLSGIQIAKRLGIGQSYAYELLTDPEGLKVRARKRSYRGRCRECGNPTDGSNGPSQTPERCDPCCQRERHWQAVKRIVGSIQRFAERYGRPPTAPDFNPHQARELGHPWRADRFYRDGDYPYSSNVLDVFGTWNAAIVAAGFERVGVGQYERADRRGAHLADERAANA